MELTLLVGAALSIAKVVKSLVDAGDKAHKLYDSIYKGAQERKLLRLDVKRKQLELSRDTLEFAEQSSERLAHLMGFRDLQELHTRTKNPVATLKILMSYYRRLRTLAELQGAGKLLLPNDDR